jgi:pre-mRNA-splicing factor SYF1
VLKRATTPRSTAGHAGQAPAQLRVHRSLRLWSLYVDFEESVGTFESTRSAYNRMLELRVCNPQTIINFATFLEENKYFEEAFSVSSNSSSQNPFACVGLLIL